MSLILSNSSVLLYILRQESTSFKYFFNSNRELGFYISTVGLLAICVVLRPTGGGLVMVASRFVRSFVWSLVFVRTVIVLDFIATFNFSWP